MTTPDLRALVLAYVEAAAATEHALLDTGPPIPAVEAKWRAYDAIVAHLTRHAPPAEVRDAALDLIVGEAAQRRLNHPDVRTPDADWHDVQIRRACSLQNDAIEALTRWARRASDAA